jgi:hypothetical protein
VDYYGPLSQGSIPNLGEYLYLDMALTIPAPIGYYRFFESPTYTILGVDNVSGQISYRDADAICGIDPDAQSYLNRVITVGGTIDSTMSAATHQLFIDLKANNLFVGVFYPMLGGTSASMAVQGRRNFGTAYDATWNGGWSFGVSGATGNGSNTYATFNVSGGTYPNTNSFLTVYGNLPNNSTFGYDLSINFNNAGGKVSQIILDFAGGGNIYAEYTGYAAVSGGNTAGFITMSRNPAGTETIRVRNGVALANKTEGCVDIDNTRQWMLGCEQASDGSAAQPTSNRYCWVAFGPKLTAAQLLTYQSIINTFQTTLGRNVY